MNDILLLGVAKFGKALDLGSRNLQVQILSPRFKWGGAVRFNSLILTD